MTIEELVESCGVTLAYFDNELYFQLITVLKIWRWRVQLFFVIINKKNND